MHCSPLYLGRNPSLIDYEMERVVLNLVDTDELYLPPRKNAGDCTIKSSSFVASSILWSNSLQPLPDSVWGNRDRQHLSPLPRICHESATTPHPATTAIRGSADPVNCGGCILYFPSGKQSYFWRNCQSSSGARARCAFVRRVGHQSTKHQDRSLPRSHLSLQARLR